MTATEMKYEIDMRLRGLPDEAKKQFITLDYNKYLNDAMLKFFLTAYSTIDRTELEKKVLSKLIVPFSTTTFTNDPDNFPNGVTVALPKDFDFTLLEYAKYKGIEKPVEVHAIGYNNYVTNIDNPFKQPYAELVWRIDYEGKHELIAGQGFQIEKYTTRYLRKPVAIDVNNGIDCEINELYHNVIVDAAVEAIVKTIAILMNKQQKEQSQPRQQQQQNNQDNDE